MYPDFNGTPLDFSLSNKEEVDIDFQIKSDWIAGNCELVAFVQDNDSKEMLCGSKFVINDIVGMDKLINSQISIYPNPAKSQLFIESELTEKIQIVDINGRIIFETLNPDNKNFIDVSNFNGGIYFVKVFSSNQVITRKLVIE
ncbi:MAG: T9SS type A sorting domain-containing protein [Bacteroidetes bacterium]|nr:T9SS type A sorting domain-containing protein [Bacteroidota bacterium]